MSVTIIIISLFLVGLMFYINAYTRLKLLFILTFVAARLSYGPVIRFLLKSFPLKFAKRTVIAASGLQIR